jgi:rare lipoprotein A
VLLVAALVAGCSSTPKPTPPRSGGFYQDDGPPEAVPAEIARVPDAVPRVEPFHPYANRPYAALGRSYTPITDDRPFRQRGFASWYGRQFHGNRTASGERYDMLGMTAAHPTLPIPSYVRVTNRKSGASVILRVNDRGPFKHDRVIDLSYAAAVKLGIAAAGTGEVDVVRLTHADIRAGRTGLAAGSPGETAATMPASPRVPMPPPAAALAVANPPAALLPPASAMPAGRWAVQLGAFSVAANADALRARTLVLLSQNDAALAAEANPRVERDGDLYRVLAGSFAERSAASQLAARLERALDRQTALYER